MKQRKATLIFMFLISVFTLVTTIVPHHHHNGLACFHAFATEHTDADAGQDAENCMCVSMPAPHLTDGGHADHQTFCNHFPAFTLLADLITSSLYAPEQAFLSELPIFIESLHDARVSCAVGLRAPPAFA